MTILASDNFNRADGGLGANWTTQSGSSSPQIRSNLVEVLVAGGAAGNAIYTAITWPNDQYAQVKILTLNTNLNKEASVWVRAITSEVTGYIFTAFGPFGSTATLKIRRFNNAALTTLWDSGASETIAANDVLRGEIIGSTVRLLINGSLRQSVVDGTPIASGSAGIGIHVISGATADSQIDDWEGGDFNTITGLRPAMRVPNVLVF